MSLRRVCLVLLTVVAAAALIGAAPPEAAPLPSAHAHNDYLHTRPLLDALDHGFTSVEADVFLVDGKLLVAHERKSLRPERTLEELYLDPLAERVKQHGGNVHAKGSRFFLLVDIKSEPQATYAELQKVLAKYEKMLAAVEDGKVRDGAVTVVITGERPDIGASDKGVRYGGLDGRPADLASTEPAHFMPMISDNWSNQFRWTGAGEMPAGEKAKLRKMTEQAHAAGRALRFWATPEKESVWQELHAANVDLINTDELARLEMFLRRADSEKGKEEGVR